MVRVRIPLTTALEALAHHPGVFSRLFISMVHAGEVSGKLDDILRRFAEFSKRQAAVREQLKTAMTYPIVLLVVGCGAMAFLVGGIIPKFMKIFLEAGVALPLPTQLLYQLSQAMRHGWWAMLVVAMVAGGGLRAVWQTPRGRRTGDRLLLQIPVIGDLVRMAAISRMTRTLETLFASGVAVLEALEIAEQTCGNTAIAEVCRSAYASVKQ